MKITKKFFMLIFSVLLIGIVINFSLAQILAPGIQLQTGKNHIEINKTLYVSELVVLNPEIESISYTDEFLNQSIGYVNIFGGIGKNFLIRENQVYEISVGKNTTLKYPKEP